MPLSSPTNFLSHPRIDPIKSLKAEVCYVKEKVNWKLITIFLPESGVYSDPEAAEEKTCGFLPSLFFLKIIHWSTQLFSGALIILFLIFLYYFL